VIVFAGGLASATTVENLGQLLASGGTLSRSIIASGGQEIVYSAGLAVGTSVGSAATETVSSSGTASGTAVSGGNSVQSVDSGAHGDRHDAWQWRRTNRRRQGGRHQGWRQWLPSDSSWRDGDRRDGAAAFKSWSQRV
jgi:autotransporter passenger strand-loop-strand repeat protein